MIRRVAAACPVPRNGATLAGFALAPCNRIRKPGRERSARGTASCGSARRRPFSSARAGATCCNCATIVPTLRSPAVRRSSAEALKAMRRRKPRCAASCGKSFASSRALPSPSARSQYLSDQPAAPAQRRVLPDPDPRSGYGEHGAARGPLDALFTPEELELTPRVDPLGLAVLMLHARPADFYRL